jgi:hypothetical protein
METANRISSNNGSWKVDRDGYVSVYYYSATSSGTGFEVYVNGVLVHINGFYGTTSGIRQTIQVTVGDIVRMRMSSGTLQNFGCYFIPPKYSTPPTPIVVDEGESGSYLLNTEIKTADTWINSKPIYKKTLDFQNKSLTSFGSVDIATLANVLPNAELILKSENVQYAPTNGMVGELAWMQMTISPDKTYLRVYSGWGNNVSGISFYSTIYYTKTTD